MSEEVDIEPLAEDLRGFARAARPLPPAPLEAKERVRARLLASLPGGGGDGSPDGSPQGQAAPPTPAAGVGGTSRLLQFAGTFVAGAIVGAAGLYALSPPRETAKVVEAAPSTRAPEPPSLPSPSALAIPRIEHSATPPLESASATPSAARAPGPSLEAERALLDPARTALGRQNPAAALEGVARHERAFPRGALVEEREAIAIQGLSQLGRKDEARQRGERFLARYPDSVLAPAVRAALEAAGVP